MYYNVVYGYFIGKDMESSPTIVQNFRNYVLRKVGICSYKYELAFKVGLAKVWGYMRVRDQNAYFFSLVEMLSQKIDKNNVAEMDWNFEILLDLIEQSSGKKTIFPHLPNPKLSFAAMPIKEPEFSISHTFTEEQIAKLLERIPIKNDNIVRIGNKSAMLSLVREDNKYIIYNPSQSSRMVTVNSPIAASKKIFKLLNRYYDTLSDKLALCVSVYKTIKGVK